MRQITWEQEQSINELIADLRRQITAYQIAKDNLELRLYGNPSFEIAGAPELPAQAY